MALCSKSNNIGAVTKKEHPKDNNKKQKQHDTKLGASWLLQLALLGGFTFQYTGYLLLLSYTRTRWLFSPQKMNVVGLYHAEVAALVVELLKVAMCVGALLINLRGNVLKVLKLAQIQSMDNPRDTLLIGIPSLLYMCQNVAMYYAATNLPPTTFIIVQQLKILTAALFSILLLGRRLNLVQWTALAMLLAGVCIVQWSTPRAETVTGQPENNTGNAIVFTINATNHSLGNENTNQHSSTSASLSLPRQQIPALGYALTLFSCVTSGFAGVFLERIYKRKRQTSIWMRNIQMSMFMVPVSACFVAIRYPEKIAGNSFLYGFDSVVWVQMFWMTAGTLIAAAVIKFADNITKDMAQSMSLLLATGASIAVFGFRPNPKWMFLAGGASVIVAISLYSWASRSAFFQQSVRTHLPTMESIEKSKDDQKQRRLYITTLMERLSVTPRLTLCRQKRKNDVLDLGLQQLKQKTVPMVTINCVSVTINAKNLNNDDASCASSQMPNGCLNDCIASFKSNDVQSTSPGSETFIRIRTDAAELTQINGNTNDQIPGHSDTLHYKTKL